MRKFIRNLFLISLITVITGEVIVRSFALVPDMPERYIDNFGIQRYKPNQTGYYTKRTNQWNVNKYGWVGTSEVIPNKTITIIGDSYIENLMNPISCNQGSLLKNTFTEYGFFEAGIAGATLLESMEVSRVLQQEINPKLQLIFVGNSDFVESISEIKKLNDRIQFSTLNNKLIPSKLKSPILKKILYNFKLGYYLYLKYPVLIKKENKTDTVEKSDRFKNNHKYQEYFTLLFNYIKNNYTFDNTVFIIHPNTDSSILKHFTENNIKHLILDPSKSDAIWGLTENDSHWSCYGHQEVSKQIKHYLKTHFLIRVKNN